MQLHVPLHLVKVVEDDLLIEREVGLFVHALAAARLRRVPMRRYRHQAAVHGGACRALVKAADSGLNRVVCRVDVLD